MPEIFLYNTLTHRKELFKPIKEGEVGLYTCGPTVYFFAQLGNFRTFIFEDILRRVLEYNGYQVKQVMNITDVGHLTGDNLGNADLGEDRMDQGAKQEGKSPKAIADFYTQAFLKDLDYLNIQRPQIMPKATDHIFDQIELIKKLQEQGLIYQTSQGVYFDTAAYQAQGYNYTVLMGQDLEEKKVGARKEVEVDHEKKNPYDFALWLFTVGRFANHLMRWESPWGTGFPGWHLECSAMSKKYLSQPFDIHTGGIDHVSIHHTNEIAQSTGAYGVPLANFWLHGEFMNVSGKRMGKSEGNAFTVADLIKRGFNPLAFRYLVLNTHYKSQMNFTWESLQAAQTALQRLREQVGGWRQSQSLTLVSNLSDEHNLTNSFLKAINNDLNLPQALAIVWGLVDSISQKQISVEKGVSLIQDFDRVLGLNLISDAPIREEIPERVQELFSLRQEARKSGDFTRSDELRREIENKGFGVEDFKEESELFRLRLDKTS